MASETTGHLSAGWVRPALLAGAGGVGALAFPAVDWSLLAWGFLVPALAAAATRPPRGALADGWLHGTVFFLILLRWLDHTFRYYSAIPWPLTWGPILALAAYCGLYTGLVAAGVARLRQAMGTGPALAFAPVLWVAGEWVRGWLMDGFPWGLLAYSQHGQLPVIQVAELTGAWGVSAVVVAVNAALAGVVVLGARRARSGLLAAGGLVAATLGFGWWALHEPAEGQRVRVAVIQPAVAQSLKWDPAHRAEILAGYEQLTREAARRDPALVLWPETAAPIFLRRDPVLLARLTELAAETGRPILVGSVDRREGTGGAFLNSAFLLTGQGISARYDKIRLVPFGEYVPLVSLIGFVRQWAEFISEFGAGEQPTVFPLEAAPFGTVICYEVVFPALFREFVARGARLMTNITNDAWFGTTSGPWQHLAALPLRAVENRVAIARAANTGVSAFVEPTGRVTGRLGLLARGTLTADLPVRVRVTLYTRWGDWFAWACAVAGGVGLVATLSRKGKR